MYMPLPLRLTLFYTLAAGLALCFFGILVYNLTAQEEYNNLDATLQSRAESVRLGKALYTQETNQQTFPLSSVDSLGTGGVAIEVLGVANGQVKLLATTTNTPASNDYTQATIVMTDTSPVPWDARAIHTAIQQNLDTGIYSTVTYQGQKVRVYTLRNPDNMQHVIQAARSEQDIEQRLTSLRLVLTGTATLVIILTGFGGWLISRGVLIHVKRITEAASAIGTAQDFSSRVSSQKASHSHELTQLITTFNQMLNGLEEAYRRQQRFIADASHELRAPITSICCNLDLLVKAPDLPQTEAQEALRDAQAEAERMGRLINQLLQLARTDASINNRNTSKQTSFHFHDYKNTILHENICDLDSLLLDIFRQYRPQKDKKNPAIVAMGPRLFLEDITPAQIAGDSDHLKQAVVAVVDNALKYTPVDGQVTFALSTSKTIATIIIRDTGIGIAAGDLPRIFDRFYRADAARTCYKEGSGLGLAIAQSILREYGGEIIVESKQGEGSTFMFQLPLAKKQED